MKWKLMDILKDIRFRFRYLRYRNKTESNDDDNLLSLTLLFFEMYD